MCCKVNLIRGGGRIGGKKVETLQLSRTKAVNELSMVQNTSSELRVQKRRQEGRPVSLVKHSCKISLSPDREAYFIHFIVFLCEAERKQRSAAQHQFRRSKRLRGKGPKALGPSASPGNDVGRDAQHGATG